MLISSTTDTQEVIDALLAPPASEGAEAAAADETEHSAALEEEEESSAEAESDGDSESTGEDDQEESENESEAPKRGFKKRIDKLSRRIGERDGRIAFLEKQLAEKTVGGKAAQAAEAVAAEPPATADAAKPALADFGTYEEYTEALTDWKIEQRERARQEQAAAKEQADTWTGRVSAAAERIPDFMDVVSKGVDVPISAAMDHLIRASEQGPDLVYHLVKHPAEAKRIAALSPLAAAHAMGKLEASLGDGAKPESVKTSTAPAPIKPVGVRSTKSQRDPGQMSMKEYNAWRDGGGGR